MQSLRFAVACVLTGGRHGDWNTQLMATAAEGCHTAPQAPSFTLWWVGFRNLAQQLDTHICMSSYMFCYTVRPAKGISLQPVNLGICPNFTSATLSSAAAEPLQCLKS